VVKINIQEKADMTTIAIKKTTWKKLALFKLKGDYETYDSMLNDWLDHP
jgi:hypothetical protein